MTAYRYVRTGRLDAVRDGSHWYVHARRDREPARRPGRRVATSSARRPAAATTPASSMTHLVAGDEAEAWRVAAGRARVGRHRGAAVPRSHRARVARGRRRLGGRHRQHRGGAPRQRVRRTGSSVASARRSPGADRARPRRVGRAERRPPRPRVRARRRSVARPRLHRRRPRRRHARAVVRGDRRRDDRARAVGIVVTVPVDDDGRRETRSPPCIRARSVPVLVGGRTIADAAHATALGRGRVTPRARPKRSRGSIRSAIAPSGADDADAPDGDHDARHRLVSTRSLARRQPRVGERHDRSPGGHSGLRARPPTARRRPDPFRRRQLLASVAALADEIRAIGGRLTVASVTRLPRSSRSPARTACSASCGTTMSPRTRESRDTAVRDALTAAGIASSASGARWCNRPGTILTAAGSVPRVFSRFHERWSALELPEPAPAGAARVLPFRARSFPPPTRAPPHRAGPTAPERGSPQFLERRRRVRPRRATSSTATRPHSCRPTCTSVRSPRARRARGRPRDSGPTRVRAPARVAGLVRASLRRTTGARRSRPAARVRRRSSGATTRSASAAWKAGRTGFPIVDAAMRELAATGWMHNRLRLITASFLVKDLLVDWRIGERHFRRLLVDGDVAQNAGNWQWVAGHRTRCRAVLPGLQSADPGPALRSGRRIRPPVAARARGLPGGIHPRTVGARSARARGRGRRPRRQLPGADRRTRRGTRPRVGRVRGGRGKRCEIGHGNPVPSGSHSERGRRRSPSARCCCRELDSRVRRATCPRGKRACSTASTISPTRSGCSSASRCSSAPSPVSFVVVAADRAGHARPPAHARGVGRESGRVLVGQGRQEHRRTRSPRRPVARRSLHETAGGFGYVSAHTAVAVALAAAIAPSFPRAAQVVAVVLAVLVGFARIYAGAHLPLDVVGGAGLGLVCGTLARIAFGVRSARRWCPTDWPGTRRSERASRHAP